MPRYDFGCGQCGAVHELWIAYEQYETVKADGLTVDCPWTGEPCCMRLLPPQTAPAFHLKGYGFYRTDNRSADERFMFDHYDGSGRNPEMRAIERRIKHPESTLPLAPNKRKG